MFLLCMQQIILILCLTFPGKWTGIVTTTRVTHATPAAAYANVAYREWESDGRQEQCSYPLGPEERKLCPDIAKQLIEDSYSKQIRVCNKLNMITFLLFDMT